jgi:hypothetical protein
MSRGHGTIQRSILAVLADAAAPLDTIEIAGRVFDVEIIEASHHQSVRRALRKLHAEGQVLRAIACVRSDPAPRRAWALPEYATPASMFR